MDRNQSIQYELHENDEEENNSMKESSSYILKKSKSIMPNIWSIVYINFEKINV